ncbi:MAG: methyltransferase domain-containing protein [Rhodospirillales bacterium]|nr:methyltransferase domain-containing protein [Rhodospirillales bacterium]
MVALDALVACLEDGKPLDDVLDRDRRHRMLEPRDRALVATITAETCRRLGQIDALVRACLKRPLPKKERVTRAILRLATAQLLFLGFAPHAAVSTAVDLARKRANAHAGLVNAILRRLGREGAAMIAKQDAALLNTPKWLWSSWDTDYGPENARAIAESHGRRAALDLSVASDAVGWAARLDARLLPTGGLRRTMSGPVDDLPGYASGGWWVQDAAASLPARLLGDVASQHVIDFCAAPGGKTAQLAAAGARVTAVDLSERRLGRLDENMSRLGLTVETVVADAVSWRPDAPVDAVLLDAPCSGTGTIRHHPDIAWTKGPDDPPRLSQLQARMIDNALAGLKPGGTLVYAVCSLQPEEGEAQLARCLERHADVIQLPVSPDEVGGLTAAVDATGCLRTLPCHMASDGGMDGFFTMRVKRST